MNANPYNNTVSQIRDKLEWIKSYANEVEPGAKFRSRLDELEKLFTPIEDNTDGTVLTREMNSSDLFYPTYEILILYDIFKYHSRLDDTSPLKKLVRELLKEKGDPRSDQTNAKGRDQQFEIQLAIMLSKAKWKITGFEDVEAISRNGISICFQCKRPRSGDNIQSNLTRALNQLLENNDVGGKNFGVAAINLDLTFATNTQHFLDASDYQIGIEFRKIGRYFINACSPILSKRQNSKVLGALGFVTFIRWNKQHGYQTIINFIPIYPKPNSKFGAEQMEIIKKALSGHWAFGETEKVPDEQLILPR